jgi:tetratricopeptide (TPR) repeat protein
LHDQVELTDAAAHYWKAIHLLEEAGEGRELGNFLGNLALLEQELGALGPARRHYEQAISLLNEEQDARLCAIALGNLGTLEAESNDWSAARRCHEQALVLLLPLGDRRSEALCRARLAASHAVLGSCKLADRELALAQRLQPEGDTARFEAVRLQRAFLDLCLAKSAWRENDHTEAKVRLEQARTRCEQVQRSELGGRPLSALSDDIRLTLRVLQPMLQQLREQLERDTPSDGGSSA